MADNRRVPVKVGEVLPPATRQVGVRVGDQVLVPPLAADPAMAQAVNEYLRVHSQAVGLLDQFYAMREHYAARRSVGWRGSADVAAQEEEEEELKHHRTVAKLRREREISEYKLAAMHAQHKLQAEEEFKPLRFATGAARLAEKTAKFRVGEAVAHASMQGYEPPGAGREVEQPERPPLVDALLQGIEDLEKQIAEREAAGLPAQPLHAQRDALRELVLRELKKAR